MISYEFNLEDEQDVAYHVKKGIESVIAARAQFRKLRFDYISSMSEDNDDSEE